MQTENISEIQGRFRKGQSGNPAGKPKGLSNKMTIAAREAFQLAFEGMGGIEGLIAWGRENPNEFYKLYGRLIPVDIRAGLQVMQFEPLIIRQHE